MVKNVNTVFVPPTNSRYCESQNTLQIQTLITEYHLNHFSLLF